LTDRPWCTSRSRTDVEFFVPGVYEIGVRISDGDELLVYWTTVTVSGTVDSSSIQPPWMLANIDPANAVFDPAATYGSANSVFRVWGTSYTNSLPDSQRGTVVYQSTVISSSRPGSWPRPWGPPTGSPPVTSASAPA
jgi:hypothetical protein